MLRYESDDDDGPMQTRRSARRRCGEVASAVEKTATDLDPQLAAGADDPRRHLTAVCNEESSKYRHPSARPLGPEVPDCFVTVEDQTRLAVRRDAAELETHRHPDFDLVRVGDITDLDHQPNSIHHLDEGDR